MTYLLQNVRLLEAFSARERADLVHFMHERRFLAGATVCTRGEHGNSMLVVTDGVLAAVVPGPDETQQEVARFEVGAILGEMFCIDPGPRPITVVAATAAVVLELGRDDLIRMRQDAPRTAASLVTAVLYETLRRLRAVHDRIEREIHAEENGGKSDPANIPLAWETCFARLRGSA